MGSLSGKNAVVTGSTSGIGLAYARAFAAAGANVVINGFGSPEDIRATTTSLAGEFQVKALYSAANMADPASIAAMIETTLDTYGHMWPDKEDSARAAVAGVLAERLSARSTREA